MNSIFFLIFVGTMSIITDFLSNREYVRYLLLCRGAEEEELFRASAEARDLAVGNGVALRGLIEVSNVCIKDCLYCGIRKSNRSCTRYELSEEEILGAADFAYRSGYGSVVLQGGERCDPLFVERVEEVVRTIKRECDNRLGITLSLGEQSEDTYRRWFEAGAHRYLLRIESSSDCLYKRIHPTDGFHSHARRVECIRQLQRCGYQTGTGVMIGFPFQCVDDLVDDLFFMKELDVDMVGMGPYLEHEDTPLYAFRDELMPQEERLRLSLHMVSCLRLMMPDVNIAATTALQAIEPNGRERALSVGANVVMPNVTPLTNRANYQLYENKPGMDEGAEESTRRLTESIKNCGCHVVFDEWGDSRHFFNRQKK